MDKIDQIGRLHPGLSQEVMAFEIEEMVGHFDRKYFQRLRAGTLADERTDNIVRWIQEHHDPHFQETLIDERQRFTEGAAKHTVLTQREWIRITAPEVKRLGDLAAAFGLPEEFTQDSSVEFRAVNFLHAARVLRFQPHRPASFFTAPLYLLESEGKIEPLSGVHSVIGFHPAIDRHNLLDFVAFHFECIDASRGLTLCASLIDIAYYLHQKRSVPYDNAIGYASNKIAALFEPPIIQERLESKSYVIRVDAASGTSLQRLLIEISEDLELLVVSARIVASLLPDTAPNETDLGLSEPGRQLSETSRISLTSCDAHQPATR